MADGIIELSDLVPELAGTGITRDGQELRGYVNGKRCPVEIQAAVAQAYQTFMHSTLESGEIKAASNRLLDRDIVLAVVDGLGLSEASLIAADQEKCHRVLRKLAWLSETGDESEGEDQGESPSTTETSSPTSTSSTGTETGENSPGVSLSATSGI